MMIAAAMLFMGPSPAARGLLAAPVVTIVKPSAMNGWYFWNDPGNTLLGSPGAMVTGPSTPPEGVGSARLGPLTTTSGATGSSVIATDAYFDTKLADITDLSYSTYQPGPTLAISLQFDVRYRTTDVNYGGRLVFEPYQNGTVVVGSGWQTWSPLAGNWWATRTNADGTGGAQAVPLPAGNCGIATPCSWSTILAAFPDAKIYGRFLLKAGSNWLGFDGNADALTIGVEGSPFVADTARRDQAHSPHVATVVTYDFEPETDCTLDCYVNAATGNDAFGGDTPASAKKTVQAAVNQVSTGGTVHVAAGTYTENVTVAKDDVTIDGAGIGSTVLQGTSCGGTGIAITGNRSGITLTDMTITGFNYGITTGNIGNTVSDILIQDLSASQNCVHGIWFQAGDTTNLVLRRVTANGNGGAGGRGFWMINGTKTDVTIEDGTFSSNALVGIDVSDGNVTGLSIARNTVTGNGDSGIGVLGPKGMGANTVVSNTVTNNGRFGIEIKIPTGNGLESGGGSVVVRENTVSRTVDATDVRDHAGIAVFRRSVGALNADQPTGVVIVQNTVTGFKRKPVGSTGDGFGIIVEGTGHIVHHNTVSDNDVGIQIQSGNTADVQGTPYFDRGNAAPSSATINRNGIITNGVALRNVGAPLTDATCNWYGSAAGPAGATITGSFTTTPYLISSDLDGTCAAAAANVLPSNAIGDEGDTLTATGTFTGTGITISHAPPVGTLDDNGDGSWSWSYPTDDDVPLTTITVTALDAFGGMATEKFDIFADNVAPTATFNAPAAVNQNAPFVISLTNPYDPSSVDTSAGFTYAFDCGSGSFGSFSPMSSATCTAPPGPATLTVRGQIMDKDPGSFLSFMSEGSTRGHGAPESADRVDGTTTYSLIVNVLGPLAPTGVDLRLFRAIGLDMDAILVWQTASEVDTLGFEVYRAAAPEGPFTLVTQHLVPARGSAGAGAVYALRDVPGSGTFYYRLEDVDTMGKRTAGHQVVRVQVGPGATGRRIFMPHAINPVMDSFLTP